MATDAVQLFGAAGISCATSELAAAGDGGAAELEQAQKQASSSMNNLGLSAKQTKAAQELRAKCGRVLLMNGTPVSERPMDAYAQANVMHRSIFDCKTYYHFRARYAVMGGYQNHEVVGYANMAEFHEKFSSITFASAPL